jgi:alkylation response protein AidB-like acyl-CoA dehydrogenase
MMIPEEYGGGGQTFLEVALLLEEMGRVLLPSPFVETAVLAPLLVAVGAPAQRHRWLPSLAAHGAVATLALIEPGWTDEWGTLTLEARSDETGLHVTGRKLFVPFAPEADLVLAAVRMDGDTALLAIEKGTPGVACLRLPTLAGDHRYEVVFGDLGLGYDALLGPARDPLERTLLHAAVASLAYMVGAAERALEMTVEYAKTRVQFGRPIGAFQAVAHRCVDMRTDLDALRYLVRQAAWTLATGRPAELAVGAAKAYGNEALQRIFLHAHQVHGAIGFSTEHDLQLFTRRAKAAELTWGSAAAHRERVARAMGLG